MSNEIKTNQHISMNGALLWAVYILVISLIIAVWFWIGLIISKVDFV